MRQRGENGYGKGREAGEKGTGSGSKRNRRREFQTPLFPPLLSEQDTIFIRNGTSVLIEFLLSDLSYLCSYKIIVTDSNS